MRMAATAAAAPAPAQEEEFNSGVLSPEELANQKKKWGNGANPNNDYYDYDDDNDDDDDYNEYVTSARLYLYEMFANKDKKIKDYLSEITDPTDKYYYYEMFIWLFILLGGISKITLKNYTLQSLGRGGDGIKSNSLEDALGLTLAYLRENYDHTISLKSKDGKVINPSDAYCEIPCEANSTEFTVYSEWKVHRLIYKDIVDRPRNNILYVGLNRIKGVPVTEEELKEFIGKPVTSVTFDDKSGSAAYVCLEEDITEDELMLLWAKPFRGENRNLYIIKSDSRGNYYCKVAAPEYRLDVNTINRFFPSETPGILFLNDINKFRKEHNAEYDEFIDKQYMIFGLRQNIIPFLESVRSTILKSVEERPGHTHDTLLEDIKQEFDSQYVRGDAKPRLMLQLHQDIIVTSLCNIISQNTAAAAGAVAPDNKFLVGVLPRGGKTYIAGGIIREYLRRNPERTLTIFWITAAPNETQSQVGRDLIEKFQEFNDFVFIPIVDAKAPAALRATKKHAVIFCSTQLLATLRDGSKKKGVINGFTSGENPLTMIFFDEAHKTGVGARTKPIVDELTKAQPVIFLTATYYKIVDTYQINPKNTFIWDYTDVVQSRKLGAYTPAAPDVDINARIYPAIENLKKRFTSTEGAAENLVDTIIQKRISFGETRENMASDYNNFPNLTFISKKTLPAELVNQGKLIPIKRHFEQANQASLAVLLTLVKETWDYVIQHSIYSKSRVEYDSPTLLMFVPTCTKVGIASVMTTWANLLMTDPLFGEKYTVACILDSDGEGEVEECKVEAAGPANADAAAVAVAGPVAVAAREGTIVFIKKLKEKDIKEQILELERKLHCVDKKGLIVLAGSKLSAGISLPCTDIVFLLNDDTSEDLIIQKMYRALTPSPGKVSTYVVDYTAERTLAAIYGYTLLAQGDKQTLAPMRGTKLAKNTRLAAVRDETVATEEKLKTLLAKTYNWLEIPDGYELKLAAPAAPAAPVEEEPPAGIAMTAVNASARLARIAERAAGAAAAAAAPPEVVDIFSRTPEEKRAIVNILYDKAIKNTDFRCMLDKAQCAVAPSAAGRGGYRRSTLRKQVKRPSRRYRR